MAKNENSISEIETAQLLYRDISTLIEQSRTRVAVVVNREITLLYWQIGKAINNSLLKNKRADYGEAIVSTLSQQLTTSFGRGWGTRHLWHCVRVADIFPDDQIVNAVSTQLSWTHFRELAAIEDDLKRTFYTGLTIKVRWSTRTLAGRIGSMLYERTALSNKPEELIRKELDLLRSQGTVTADLVFRDPYVLNFLGLPDTYSENDFEFAILNQLQQFIIELGSDFAFIARQKRIIVDNEDYKMDLLFYHRGLKRLVAIALNLTALRQLIKGKWNYI